MDMYLGIDPGCSGAVVLIGAGGEYVDHMAMPTIKVGTKSRVNGAALAAWIRQHSVAHAWLEQVGAMPGQGTASMFTFGHAAGVAEGILQGAEHSLHAGDAAGMEEVSGAYRQRQGRGA